MRFIDAAASAGIALRVQINQQYFLVIGRQTGRQINASGGFAHAAFLIGNR